MWGVSKLFALIKRMEACDDKKSSFFEVTNYGYIIWFCCPHGLYIDIEARQVSYSNVDQGGPRLRKYLSQCDLGFSSEILESNELAFPVNLQHQNNDCTTTLKN